MSASDIALLTDALPDTVLIGNAEVPINTDFRCGIQFERLMLDGSLSDAVKVNTALEMYFGGYAKIRDRAAAVKAALRFFACGREVADGAESKRKQSGRIYDYAADARLIYAAFLEQYGVDLQRATLHWWQFCAMMAGLNSETEFSKVLGYRAIDLSKIKSREERARYQKLQAIYALPDNRTHEEKVASAGRAFGRAMGL